MARGGGGCQAEVVWIYMIGERERGDTNYKSRMN